MTQVRGPILDARKARYAYFALIFLTMGYVNEVLNHGLNLNLLCEFGPKCIIQPNWKRMFPTQKFKIINSFFLCDNQSSFSLETCLLTLEWLDSDSGYCNCHLIGYLYQSNQRDNVLRVLLKHLLLLVLIGSYHNYIHANCSD